jgi:hypothetical protein
MSVFSHGQWSSFGCSGSILDGIVRDGRKRIQQAGRPSRPAAARRAGTKPDGLCLTMNCRLYCCRSNPMADAKSLH